jgi:hypothetical protein
MRGGVRRLRAIVLGVISFTAGCRVSGGNEGYAGWQTSFCDLKDMNTLSIVTPALSLGPQQLVLINPDGESVAFDAAFFAQ